MADPTAVNSQITDSVTQANTQSLGNAPAMAMAALYQATAQALATAAHNATIAQQNANTILQATTTQGAALLYGIQTSATTEDLANILQGANPSAEHLDALIAALTRTRDALRAHEARAAGGGEHE